MAKELIHSTLKSCWSIWESKWDHEILIQAFKTAWLVVQNNQGIRFYKTRPMVKHNIKLSLARGGDNSTASPLLFPSFLNSILLFWLSQAVVDCHVSLFPMQKQAHCCCRRCIKSPKIFEADAVAHERSFVCNTEFDNDMVEVIFHSLQACIIQFDFQPDFGLFSSATVKVFLIFYAGSDRLTTSFSRGLQESARWFLLTNVLEHRIKASRSHFTIDVFAFGLSLYN